MVHKMKNAVILLFGGYVIDCEVYFMEEMKMILESRYGWRLGGKQRLLASTCLTSYLK